MKHNKTISQIVNNNDIAEVGINRKFYLFVEILNYYYGEKSILIELIDKKQHDYVCNCAFVVKNDFDCNTTVKELKKYGKKVIKTLLESDKTIWC